MMSCEPGFVPRLLGCVSDDADKCEDATLACALLSLLVSISVAVIVVVVVYWCMFRPNFNDILDILSKKKKS